MSSVLLHIRAPSLSLSPQSNENDPLVGKQSSATRVRGQDEDIRSEGRDHESQEDLALLNFCGYFWRGIGFLGTHEQKTIVDATMCHACLDTVD